MNHPAEDCVVLLSPEGRGAVATLAVAGPNANALIARHVHRSGSTAAALEASSIDRILYGRWKSSHGVSPDPGRNLSAAADEDVVVCRRGDSLWEIHCHGGVAAVQRILADLAQAGCRQLLWREWTDRQESNPVRAAAIAMLASARTERTAAILLDQHDGAWQRALAEIRRNLASDQTATAAAQLQTLLRLATLGTHLVVPWRVVVAGPPNVGKSSLINALVGYRRAIVHDQPGTTRDAVSVQLAVDGWPVDLIDTAGLRASDDALETAGVARAHEELRTADAALLVFEAVEPWTAQLATLASLRPDAIIIYNKSDLLAPTQGSTVESPTAGKRPFGLLTSAVTSAGLDQLLGRLSERLVPVAPDAGDAVPILAAQAAQLRGVLERLKAADIQAAFDLL